LDFRAFPIHDEDFGTHGRGYPNCTRRTRTLAAIRVKLVGT
jgi:hypothetical protein